MTNKSDWRQEFKRAVIDALIKDGYPLRDGSTFYGGIASDWEDRRNKVDTIGIDYDRTTWTEAEWHEFKGTFYEGDTRTVGIDVQLVLLDGTVMKWRFEGIASDLIFAVVRDGDT